MLCVYGKNSELAHAATMLGGVSQQPLCDEHAGMIAGLADKVFNIRDPYRSTYKTIKLP